MSGVPQTISRFPIIGEIARGGMGVVFRAHDPEQGRDVAIKLLSAGRRADARQRERFLREGRSLTKLDHPHIVPVYEFGEHDGYPYLVMELVDGMDLSEHVRACGSPPSVEAAELLLGLARATHAVHAIGVLHRDIKPENVLLRGGEHPLLGDFGLIKDDEADVVQLSKTGEHLGSPGYWSPEQAMGERERLGPHSDVYSLGATLYYVLTGSSPFEAGSVMEAVIATCNTPPAPPSEKNPEVHPELEAICLKCLEKEPSDRYATASALADELDAFVESQAVARRLSPRRSRIGPLTVAAALGVLVVGASELWRGRTNDDLRATEARVGDMDLGAWLQRARFLHSKGDLLPALRACDQALDLAPEDAAAHALRARVLLQLGRLDQAIHAASQALSIEPGEGDAYATRGLAHAQRGDHQSARGDFAHALSLEPNHLDTLIGRARSSFELGLYGEAEADCTRALKLDPTQPTTHSHRGAARFKLGNVEGAAEDFQRAAELAPDWSLAHLNAGLALQRLGRDAPAAKHYERVVALDPLHAGAHNGLGEVRLRLGQARPAHAAFSRAMDLGRQDAGIYANRALCSAKLDDPAAALKDLDQALLMDPKLAPAHYQRGLALSALDREGDALPAFRAAMANDPADARPAFKVGLLLARAGDLEAAIDGYGEALSRDPELVQALVNRAGLLLQLDRIETAIQDLERALQLLPSNHSLRPKVADQLAAARARLQERG